MRAARATTLRFGTEVDRVAAVDGGVRIAAAGRDEAFDGAVVAAGIRSREIGAALGDRVNVYPVKGYSITVALKDDAEPNGGTLISLLDDRAKSRRAASARTLPGGRHRRAQRRQQGYPGGPIRPLVEWCEKHFPAMSTEHATPWTGLRPMMPSMMPRVGRGKAPGVFYNTGHGHLGWTLSAATARIVAEFVAAELNSSRVIGPLGRLVAA